MAYTCTLLKSTKIVDGVEDKEHPGLHRKDRYFSLKLQPVREKPGKWWPSVAIGVNDLDFRVNWLKTQHETDVSRVVNSYFSNYYVALSKHFRLKGNVLGVHMAYRHWRWSLNSKWNGPVGGITALTGNCGSTCWYSLRCKTANIFPEGCVFASICCK